jgi:AraC-like DNA-binding protein
VKLLQLRTNLNTSENRDAPFHVYTVGTENQSPLTRLTGFSASQLFVTFSGTGIFRTLGKDKWDIIAPGTLLYIPKERPYECFPQGEAPWQVGYVTFFDGKYGMLDSWGYDDNPQYSSLQKTDRLFELIEQIWSHSGPDYNLWKCSEYLFTFCIELKKQSHQGYPALPQPLTSRFRDSVVDHAVRFLHDHLQRELNMTDLSSYVGYSPKQLTRLFQQSVGTTPMQYVQELRLKTAHRLLHENPEMTIRQIAAHVGLEPVYFTRLFSRKYGVTPSDFKSRLMDKL